jgi:Ring finger domain
MSEDYSIPDEEIGENSHAIPRVINSQRLQQGASNRGDANSQHDPRLQLRGSSQPSDSQHQGQADSSSSFNLQNEFLMQQLIMARGRRQAAPHMDAFEALGTQKDGKKPVSDKGLHPFQLDQIVAYEFNKEKVKSEDPSKLECCICLVPYQTGVQVKVLQCVHTFHAKCIDEWLVKKSICPECNFNLRSVDPREFV